MVLGTGNKKITITVFRNRTCSTATIGVVQLSGGTRFEYIGPGGSISSGSVNGLILAITESGITIPRISDLEAIMAIGSMADNAAPMLRLVR